MEQTKSRNQAALAKSYNFDAARIKEPRQFDGIGSNGQTIMSEVAEERTANGYYVAYACGPLKKQRYINPKIEQELEEFKKEIDQKFQKAEMTQYHFPRPLLAPR